MTKKEENRLRKAGVEEGMIERLKRADEPIDIKEEIKRGSQSIKEGKVITVDPDKFVDYFFKRAEILVKAGVEVSPNDVVAP